MTTLMCLIRERLGYDQPLVIQYLAWLRELVGGNLGFSLANGRPVGTVLIERLGGTTRLVVAALVVAVILGIVLGMLAAIRKNTWVDYTITGLSLLAISVPPFFLALIGIFIFGLNLRLLPTSGMQSLGSDGDIGDMLRHLILPGGILALVMLGPYVRYARASILEALNSEYIVTARAKGIGSTRVLFGHALKNASIPLITVIALQIPVLLAGTVVIETMFAWPGMGKLAIDSIMARDYPIILAFVLFVAILVLACNLLADVLYALIDPRIRVK
ncbi:MAG: ABC transporter permease [Microbacterium sp.]|nr:MAG: ABC transporter permease [Microbacterium sp.]